MIEKKRAFLEGYRKMIMGLITFGLAVVVGMDVSWDAAFKYVVLANAVFCGANIWDRFLNNKKGVS